MAFLAGAVLTWICHSSPAVVLLLTTFVMNGSPAPEQALPFVLGLNFGGGLPALSATTSQPAAARQLPIANLPCRGGLAVAALMAMAPLLRGLDLLHLRPATAVAQLHMRFNLAAAAIFLPLSEHVLRLVRRLLPADTPAGEAPITLSGALGPCHATYDADQCRAGNPARSGAAGQPACRASEGAWRLPVRPLTAAGQTGDETRRARMILHYAGSLEHAGDIIRRNLGDRAQQKVRLNTGLGAMQRDSLPWLLTAVLETLRVLSVALCSDDLEVAKDLASRKDVFRAGGPHRRRRPVSQGPPDSAAPKLFLDLLRDLHRVNSVLSAAAYLPHPQEWLPLIGGLSCSPSLQRHFPGDTGRAEPSGSNG